MKRLLINPFTRAVRSPAAGRNGAVLGMVMMVMVIVSVLGVGIIGLGTTDAVETAKALSAAQAFWTSEAGLEKAKAILRKNPRPLDDVGMPGIGSAVISGTTARGTFSAGTQYDPAWNNAFHAAKKYILTSTGVSQGQVTRTIQLHAMLHTLGSYVIFTGLEQQPDGSPIYYGDNDIMDGPVRSNDRINLWHMPEVSRAYDTMSSASDVYERAVPSSYDPFDGGNLILNVDPVAYSQITNYYTEFATAATQPGGLVVTGDYTFAFRTNLVTYWKSGDTNQYTNAFSSLTQPIYVAGSITSLYGVVDATNAIVIARDAIRITGNLVYESASGSHPGPWSVGFNPDNVNDSLILVAQNEVEVMGTTPLAIHAGIVVSGDAAGLSDPYWGFCAEHYDRNIKVSGNQPVISFYGVAIQYRRGMMGWQTPGSGGPPSPTGFSRNFKWDGRMENMAFPYDRYDFSSWHQVK